ncbi:MAG: tRNA preQ1(34) S-adenosylmethionine ribosyltransferase-isomerase QueA [Bacteroidota bacterium]
MSGGSLSTSDFGYVLPADRIAQHPAATRDESRLLVLRRDGGPLEHRRFRDLPEYLGSGDLLVVNDTRVIPARLFAKTPRAAGCAMPRDVELLLVREEPAVPPERIWLALARPARRLRVGLPLAFTDPAWTATVSGVGERGTRRVAFRPHGDLSFEGWLTRVGHVPIPPYIERPDGTEDRERYQTVYAREPGSVAAPTAGLHFTEATLEACRARGVAVGAVTLHVGPGTFRPVATEDPREHALDPEAYRVPPETVEALRAARAAAAGEPPRAERGRVVAVGTTAVRALESWAIEGEPADGAWRETSLFILPGFGFRVVRAMVTNFHLPRSSLLFLVSALAGRERILAAYEEAVREGYRFYSYGDAMLIL